MIRWIVQKDQVDKHFTLKELKEFSKEHNAKIIVNDVCTFKNGEIIWLM